MPRSILDRKPSLWICLTGIVVVAAVFRLYRIVELPPGLYRDEAYNGLDALAVAQGIRHPLYFEGNNGREPMHIYLQALLLLFLPPSALTLRLASVLIGSLTPLTIYVAGREILAQQSLPVPDQSRRIGLIASFSTAILFWMVNFSRIAFRAVLLPPLSALAFAFLWKGFNGRKGWAFACAGLLFGLCMYTYLAANFLPLLVVLVILYQALARQRFWATYWKGLVLLTVVGLIVFAPLGYVFVSNPRLALRRAEQVTAETLGSGAQAPLQTIMANTIKWLLAWSFRGDPLDRHNLAERPALDAFQSILFWIGCGVALWKFKTPAYGFLVLWLCVMLLPSILTPEAPHFLRAIGSVPPLTILIAVGCMAIYDCGFGLTYPRRKQVCVALALLLIGGFVWSGYLSFRDYFLVWAEKPGLFTHFDAGPFAIGQYIATTPPEENIYVSPIPIDLASLQFGSGQKEPAKSFNGRRCLVLLDQPKRAISYIIVYHEDTRSLDALRVLFPQGRIAAQGPLHYGQPYFLVYRVPAHTRAQLAPQFSQQANWQNKLRLLGFDVDGLNRSAGEQIELTFYWQALSDMDTPYTIFVHLLGDLDPANGGPLWAGFDKQPGWDSYPTIYWTPGEIVVDRHTLSVPKETPPGIYELEIGLYYWATGERLSVENGADHLILGTVQIK